MKAEIIKDEEQFKPFSIRLDIETIEEARLLFHVFNTANLGSIVKNNEQYAFCQMLYLELAETFGGNTWEIIKDHINSQGFNV